MYGISLYNNGDRDHSEPLFASRDAVDRIIRQRGLILDSVLGNESSYTNHRGDVLYVLYR